MISRGELISSDFYLREDVVGIAQELIGAQIHSLIDGELTSGIITETEAYKASEDKASHAYGNRVTARTSTMFKEGGRSYVYLCYGIHKMLNVVTGPEGTAHAVLIRAIEPVNGIEIMLKRRKMDLVRRNLTAGPGLLAQSLGISMEHNDLSLVKETDLIWITQATDKPELISSPRVGVGYAEECATWPWRFRMKDSSWTSPAK